MFTSWTDGAIARVAELLRKGKSASEIGADMGIARNAVIGKVHRTPLLAEIGFARLPTGGSSCAGAAADQSFRPAAIVRRVARQEVVTKRNGAATTRSATDKKPAVPVKKVLLDFVTPSRSQAKAFDEASRRIPLEELGGRDCHWPVNDTARGDGSLFLFCGLVADDGHRYCLHHCLRALGDGTQAKAKLLDKAARQALQAA